MSKSLSDVQRNYEIHDKEMLAIIRALEEWQHFLEGAQHTIEVWTNHKNPEYFRTSRNLNRRQARWSLYLSRFDYTLHHRPGRSMGKPDALSRRSDHGTARDNQDVVLLKPKSFRINALTTVHAQGGDVAIVRDIRDALRLSPDLEEPVAKAAQELFHATGTIHDRHWYAPSNGL